MKKYLIIFLISICGLFTIQTHSQQKKQDLEKEFALEIKMRETAFINSAGVLYLFFKARKGKLAKPREIVIAELLQTNAFDALHRFLQSYKSRHISCKQTIESIKRIDEKRQLQGKLWRNVVGLFEFLQGAKTLTNPVQSPAEMVERVYEIEANTSDKKQYQLVDLIRCRLVDECKTLCESFKKNEINDVLKGYNSPLLHAVLFDNPSIVQTLIEAKADVNIMNVNGVTPLLCCYSTDVKTILLSAKADIKATDSLQQTALMLAAFEKKNQAVRALLDLKCDVNAKNNDNATALFYALWNKPKPSQQNGKNTLEDHLYCRQVEEYIKTIKTLCQAGADLSVEVDEETPYSYVKKKEIEEKKLTKSDPTIKAVLKILRQHGAEKIEATRKKQIEHHVSESQKRRQRMRKLLQQNKQKEQELLEKFKDYIQKCDEKRKKKMQRDTFDVWFSIYNCQLLSKIAQKYYNKKLQHRIFNNFKKNVRKNVLAREHKKKIAMHWFVRMKKRGIKSLRNYAYYTRLHKTKKNVLAFLKDFAQNDEMHRLYALNNATTMHSLYNQKGCTQAIVQLAVDECCLSAQRYLHYFKDRGHSCTSTLIELHKQSDQIRRNVLKAGNGLPGWDSLQKAYLVCANAYRYRSFDDMCQKLYEKDSSFDMYDKYFNSILDIIRVRNLPRTRLLVPKLNFVHKQNENGLTALHVAVYYNMTDFIPTLLKHGADKTRRAYNGVTPLDLIRTEPMKKLLTQP